MIFQYCGIFYVLLYLEHVQEVEGDIYEYYEVANSSKETKNSKKVHTGGKY